MATEQQIEANRRNAKKSTGPRTPEGKAVVSQNAFKTGIDAQTAVVRATENPADLDALIAEFYHRFQPANIEQRCLVDALIRYEWLTRRFTVIEAQLMDLEISTAWNPDPALPMAHGFTGGSTPLERLQRRMTAAAKAFQKTLELLRKLQASDDAPSQPAAPVDCVPAQTLAPVIGFVPTKNIEPDPPPETGAPEPNLALSRNQPHTRYYGFNPGPLTIEKGNAIDRVEKQALCLSLSRSHLTCPDPEPAG